MFISNAMKPRSTAFHPHTLSFPSIQSLSSITLFNSTPCFPPHQLKHSLLSLSHNSHPSPSSQFFLLLFFPQIHRMSSLCSDQHHHKFLPSHQLLSPKKSPRDIEIPPRKLLTRRSALSSAMEGGSDMFSDDTVFQKFLLYNNPSADSDSGSETEDPYSSDHFRMYEFKIRRCTRSRSHDWTDCPFAHPGEKARRRDPRRFHYSGTVCPEYRRGSCSRGDSCQFAHGVFECWLHPERYRTEACKDGKNCKRKVCFFAHTPKQLRILPVTMSSSNEMSPCKKNKLNCCVFCHNCGGSGVANSPTSTLFGMSRFSPPLSPSSSAASPPLSPAKRVSPVSRYCRGGGAVSNSNNNLSYKDMVNELMSSLEGLGLSFSNGSRVSVADKPTNNLAWIDVSPQNCEDLQEYVKFSPSMVAPTSYDDNVGKYTRLFSKDDNVVAANASDINASNFPAPDLGWVNELLM